MPHEMEVIEDAQYTGSYTGCAKYIFLMQYRRPGLPREHGGGGRWGRRQRLVPSSSDCRTLAGSCTQNTGRYARSPVELMLYLVPSILDVVLDPQYALCYTGSSDVILDPQYIEHHEEPRPLCLRRWSHGGRGGAAAAAGTDAPSS